jgi:sugar/nucleoside kinase (ribokinase family)
MSGAHYTAFVMGTATWDRVVKRSAPPEDSKSVRLHRYKQSGGSAVNTRTAFGALANADGSTTTVWAGMKMGETGRKNPYKDRVLAEIGDHHLMDPAFREEGYTISDNDITIWNDPETGDVKRSITKAQDDIETPIYPGVHQEIASAVAECDVVILNSRFPDIALTAAREAKKRGIPVVLDYSETNPDLIARCEELIRMSDYVLADGHSLLPGMDKKDANELRHRFVEDYDCQNVAVSDNRKPIKVYADGRAFDVTIPMPDVPQVDNLGTGDVRDGAFGYYIAKGKSFLTALIRSSVIASNSVAYYGREWVSTLPQLIATHPSFAEAQDDPTMEFAGVAAGASRDTSPERDAAPGHAPHIA